MANSIPESQTDLLPQSGRSLCLSAAAPAPVIVCECRVFSQLLFGEIHAELRYNPRLFEVTLRGNRETNSRVLSSLHGADEAPSSLLSGMVRVPYPAQSLAIMGVSKRWQLARNANVVAECGAGKTLIALGSMLVHSAGKPFSGLVMAPPHLIEKWARETFLTLPQVRVFLINDVRNGGDPTQPHGINEVRLRRGEIVREGLHTSLAELRPSGT